MIFALCCGSRGQRLCGCPGNECAGGTEVDSNLELESLDLVIANSALPEISELLHSLRTRHTSLKVITIKDRTLVIATSEMEAREARWLTEIRTVLESPPNARAGNLTRN